MRILIAEDHAVVRDGLASLLTYKGHEVVGAVSNGLEAVAQYRELRPEVVLMDLRMPEMGGVEAISAIRELDPEARVIALTTYSGDEDIHRSLRAGAMGYLLKDTTTEKLLEAIEAVAAGNRSVPEEVAFKLVERSTMPSLTARETEILEWLAKGKTNKEIGIALGISEGTIKTHVNSLLEKLSVADRTEAVMVGIRRGLIHLKDD